MRCFIAIDVPKEIKDKIYITQKGINKDLAKINWVSKRNLHITLKFLGDVDNKKLEEVKSILDRLSFDPFTLRIGRLGVFPDWDHVNVIWLSLLPEKDLIRFQQTIDGELLPLFSGDQTFKSHLTLGRVKLVKKKDLFINVLKNVIITAEPFNVDSFSLYSSTLSKDGPTYHKLMDYPRFS